MTGTRKILTPATGTPAVLGVGYEYLLSIIHPYISDSLNIGCFESFESEGSYLRDYSMTPCLCSGYCSANNYSLAAIGYRSG